MLITFSGLDGSGKSTLIAWLRAELERANRAVTVLHMTNDVGVYGCLRRLRDALAPPPRDRSAPSRAPAPVGRKRLARRIRDTVVWSKVLRRALYPVDLIMFAAVRVLVEGLQRRILVTDRYFYDTLVDVADRGSGVWVRLLEWLTPAPDLAVFLDVTPAESYARKGEYTVAYLARRSVAYRAVAPLVPSALVLVNDDLATTRSALRHAVWERLRP